MIIHDLCVRCRVTAAGDGVQPVGKILRIRPHAVHALASRRASGWQRRDRDGLQAALHLAVGQCSQCVVHLASAQEMRPASPAEDHVLCPILDRHPSGGRMPRASEAPGVPQQLRKQRPGSARTSWQAQGVRASSALERAVAGCGGFRQPDRSPLPAWPAMPTHFSHGFFGRSTADALAVCGVATLSSTSRIPGRQRPGAHEPFRPMPKPLATISETCSKLMVFGSRHRSLARHSVAPHRQIQSETKRKQKLL